MVVFPPKHAAEWAPQQYLTRLQGELGITQRRFAAWTADVAIRNPITNAWKVGSAQMPGCRRRYWRAWQAASPADAFVQAALAPMFSPASARPGSMLRPHA